jgi:hypothetical protein
MKKRRWNEISSKATAYPFNYDEKGLAEATAVASEIGGTVEIYTAGFHHNYVVKAAWMYFNGWPKEVL